MICSNAYCNRVVLVGEAGQFEISIRYMRIRADLCLGCVRSLVESIRQGQPLVVLRASSESLGSFERESRLEPWFPKPKPGPERTS